MNHYYWELVFLLVWSFSTAEVFGVDPKSEVLGVDPNSEVLAVDQKSIVSESKSKLVPEILSDNIYGVSLGSRQERH